jgi:hypothetical protein
LPSRSSARSQPRAAPNHPDPGDAIPTLLEGRDLLGIAQTGTGKTAAFVLPRSSGWSRRTSASCRPMPHAGPGPTRELASQIAENAKGYAKFSKLAVATVFGGTSLNKNRQDLSRGVDILVATPGRLIDLVEQGFLNLSMIEILVLDEADQMLDLGFIRAAPHREDDPAQAPDAVLLGHHARRDPRSGRQVPRQSCDRHRDPGVDHRRARRPVGDFVLQGKSRRC